MIKELIELDVNEIQNCVKTNLLLETLKLPKFEVVEVNVEQFNNYAADIIVMLERCFNVIDKVIYSDKTIKDIIDMFELHDTKLEFNFVLLLDKINDHTCLETEETFYFKDFINLTKKNRVLEDNDKRIIFVNNFLQSKENDLSIVLMDSIKDNRSIRYLVLLSKDKVEEVD